MKMFGLLRPKLEPEAFFAYIHRMPNIVNVKWQKDGDYIVGEVDYDNFSFVTQAKNVEEFVELVNEGVIISNNIPKDYIKALRGAKRYFPNPEALNELIQAAPGSHGSWEAVKEKSKPVFA